MLDRVHKATWLAIAFVLVGSGAAFAGENADAVVTLTSPVEVSGVGPGASSDVSRLGLCTSGQGLPPKASWGRGVGVRRPPRPECSPHLRQAPDTGLTCPPSQFPRSRVR